MTSKEALDKLPELMLAKDITKLKEISECFNIIYESLEVLEILKKYLYIGGDSWCDTIRLKWDGIDNIVNKTDFNKLKEWLGNE